MRRRGVVILVAAAAVLLVGVGVMVYVLRPSDPGLPASPTFMALVRQQMAGVRPVPVSPGAATPYQFPANIGEPLQRLNDGWTAYVQQLADTFPGLRGFENRPVAVIEDDGSASYDAVCQVQTLPSPVPISLTRPLYCRTVQPAPNAVMQTGLILLPKGFTERLRQAVKDLAQDDQWWVAGMIASLYYQDHLTHEMANAGITWPRGPLFDWCLVGAGMRTMTAVVVNPQRVESLLGVVADLIGAPPTPIKANQQLALLGVGYVTGRPESCEYSRKALPK